MDDLSEMVLQNKWQGNDRPAIIINSRNLLARFKTQVIIPCGLLQN